MIAFGVFDLTADGLDAALTVAAVLATVALAALVAAATKAMNE